MKSGDVFQTSWQYSKRLKEHLRLAMRTTSQPNSIPPRRGNPSPHSERAYRAITIAFVLLLIASL